ncbi:hypothetical protein [Clostridium scatologenes]|uniref:Uncharacterized protein n=1 Tax=Clostridium scatologenes TaxID=1548 RepID=A0A0E3M9L0_CLOSL|nr:hypothetical protein [Clostridium scatologenes]AKA69725.1 hypothetical protein CSCA_2600 [Clostridium scatologenes]
MLNKVTHEKYKILLNELYCKCNYQEFVIAFNMALRAHQRILKQESVFDYANFNLNVINTENMLIPSVFEYYLNGNGEKENLNEDVFPLINVLCGNKASDTADELRQLFLNSYN